MTGKPETRDFTTLVQDFKKEGHSFAKRLQRTVFVITALLFVSVFILNGSFETAFFIAIAGIIVNILVGIWLK